MALKELYLYNTYTKDKALFKPLFPNKVTMYNCGPTVYGRAHVGNLRSYVFADILKRVLEWNGYKVTQVINITDVGHLVSDGDEGEDKMLTAVKKEHKKASEIADFYTKLFFEDITALGVDISRITFPKATDYIGSQIAMIQTLAERGFTYTTSDGVYFDTSRFPNYGLLGNIDLGGLEEGKRIGVNTEKRNATDFALWKFSPKNQGAERQQEWDSPWGVGFPGWHIECSAMAKELLGQTIDIHTGGIDHIPVHHNNEIAQSECANGSQFVRTWMHNAHMMIDGQKISKSLGNTVYLDELSKRGYSPFALRYFFLSASYRTSINFTWDAIKASDSVYKRLVGLALKLKENSPGKAEADCDFDRDITEAVNDDLNTSRALSLLFTYLKKDEKPDIMLATLLRADAILGLGIREGMDRYTLEKEPSPEVLKLLEERAQAREAKNWKRSDEIREALVAQGYEIRDTADRQAWFKIIEK